MLDNTLKLKNTLKMKEFYLFINILIYRSLKYINSTILGYERIIYLTKLFIY